MVARARRWTRGVLVRLAGVEADDAGMSTAEYATVRLCTLGTSSVPGHKTFPQVIEAKPSRLPGIAT